MDKDLKLIGDILFLAEYDEESLRITGIISQDGLRDHAEQLKAKGAWRSIEIKVKGFIGEHGAIILPPGQHLEINGGSNNA